MTVRDRLSIGGLEHHPITIRGLVLISCVVVSIRLSKPILWGCDSRDLVSKSYKRLKVLTQVTQAASEIAAGNVSV